MDMYNNILDVKGLKVGQVEDENGLTGCTVVICEEGAVCGVDVRGAAPGTREILESRIENRERRMVRRIKRVFSV